MNMQHKMESGIGLPWLAHSHTLSGAAKTSVDYCPGHVGVWGNEGADSLASTADITSCQKLGRAEVELETWGTCYIVDRPEHHSTDCLKERDVEKAANTPSSEVGNNMCSTKHCHCFECNLVEAAERWDEVCMDCSERCKAILNGNWKTGQLCFCFRLWFFLWLIIVKQNRWAILVIFPKL